MFSVSLLCYKDQGDAGAQLYWAPECLTWPRYLHGEFSYDNKEGESMLDMTDEEKYSLQVVVLRCNVKSEVYGISCAGPFRNNAYSFRFSQTPLESQRPSGCILSCLSSSTIQFWHAYWLLIAFLVQAIPIRLPAFQCMYHPWWRAPEELEEDRSQQSVFQRLSCRGPCIDEAGCCCPQVSSPV